MKKHTLEILLTAVVVVWIALAAWVVGQANQQQSISDGGAISANKWYTKAPARIVSTPSGCVGYKGVPLFCPRSTKVIPQPPPPTATPLPIPTSTPPAYPPPYFTPYP